MCVNVSYISEQQVSDKWSLVCTDMYIVYSLIPSLPFCFLFRWVLIKLLRQKLWKEREKRKWNLNRKCARRLYTIVNIRVYTYSFAWALMIRFLGSSRYVCKRNRKGKKAWERKLQLIPGRSYSLIELLSKLWYLKKNICFFFYTLLNKCDDE